MNKLITVLAVCIISISFAQEFPIHDYSGPVYDFGTSFSDREEKADDQSEVPLWSVLEQLTIDERNNSSIEFECNNSNLIYSTLIKASTLWNKGNDQEALTLLKSLDQKELSKAAVGITWKTPRRILSKPNWGADFRIGDRDSIDLVSLTYEKSSGNLFAVLCYKQNNGYAWSVNLSTDGGLTWSETYDWGSTTKIYTISATVVNSHCYVAYTTITNKKEGRLRRFSASNGSYAPFPDASAYITVVNVAEGDSVKQIVLGSNQVNMNNRLYFAALTASDSILMYWNYPVNVVFNKYISTLNDAKEGLDITWNNGFTGFNYSYYNFGSYITNNNEIKTFGCPSNSDSIKALFSYFPGYSRDYSSISSQNDTITAVFGYYDGGTYQIRYVVSYNGGSIWKYGLAGDSLLRAEAPDIAAGDAGVGIIYRYYTPLREGRFTWRPMAGSWSTPIKFTDYEPYYNKPAIEYLGNRKFGVVYLSWSNPVQRGAYFDVHEITPVDVDDNITQTPDSYKLLQNYPNPFNPSTLIRYEIPSPSFVTIKIYDALGNLVENLVNEEQSAGAYEAVFDASKLSSGVYFYTLQAGSVIRTNKMVLAR